MTDTSNRLTGVNSAPLAAIWGDPAPAAPTATDYTDAITGATTAANIATQAAASANTAIANLAGAPSTAPVITPGSALQTPDEAAAAIPTFLGLTMNAWLALALAGAGLFLIFHKKKKE